MLNKKEFYTCILYYFLALSMSLEGQLFESNNICLSCWIFGSVLFVVFLKIELANVVNENYSSQIVEAKITVYESLRVRQVTDHKFLEGKIESLTMRKGYSS